MPSGLGKCLCFILLWMVMRVEAATLDLKQAIEYALAHHIDLKWMDADRQVRWHELSILQKKFSPQIVFSMSGTIHHEEYFNEKFDEQKLHAYPTLRLLTPIGTTIEIFSEQNIGYELGQKKTGAAIHVTIDQPLLKGRKKAVNTYALDNAKLVDEIESLAYQKTVDNIIYHVIVAYHTVLVNIKKKDLQTHWLNQSQLFYSALKSKWEAGRVSLNDVNIARFNLKQAEFQLNQTHLEIRQSLRKLCQLIGWEGEEMTLSPPSIQSQISLNQHNKWIETAFSHDLQARILNIRSEQLQNDLIVAKDQQRYELLWRANVTLGRYHIFGDAAETDQSDDYIYTYPFVHQSGNYSTELQINIPLTGKSSRYHQELSVRTAIEKLEMEKEKHHHVF